MTHAGMDVSIEEIDVGPCGCRPEVLRGDADLLAGIDGPPLLLLHDFTLDGIDVTVSRTGYTGEIGYEITRDARRTRKLWQLVLEAESRTGCGSWPCHIRRIEGGMLARSTDITVQTTPSRSA